MSYTAEQPIQYTPDPSKFGALAGGKVWFGVPNGNPASVPGDRIQVYLARQGLADLAISQPIDIGPGGVWYYSGSPAQIKVLVPYCVQILNSLGVQKFYSPAAGDEIVKFNQIDSDLLDRVRIIDSFTALASTSATIGEQVSVLGDQGGLFDVVAAGSLANDGGWTVLNGSIAFTRNAKFPSPQHFGTTATTNSNAAFLLFLTYLKLNPKPAVFTSDVRLSGDVTFDFANAVIDVDFAGFKIINDGTLTLQNVGQLSEIKNPKLYNFTTPWVITRWDSSGNWVSTGTALASLTQTNALGYYQPTVNDADLYASLPANVQNQNIFNRLTISGSSNITITKPQGRHCLYEFTQCSDIKVDKPSIMSGGKGTYGTIVFNNIATSSYGLRNRVTGGYVGYGSYSGVTFMRNKFGGVTDGFIPFRVGESGVKTYQGNIGANSSRCYNMTFGDIHPFQCVFDGVDFSSDYGTPVERLNDYTLAQFGWNLLPTSHTIYNIKATGCRGLGIWGDGQFNTYDNIKSEEGQISGIHLICSNSIISDAKAQNNNITNTATGTHQILLGGTGNKLIDPYVQCDSRITAGTAIYVGAGNDVYNESVVTTNPLGTLIPSHGTVLGDTVELGSYDAAQASTNINFYPRKGILTHNIGNISGRVEVGTPGAEQGSLALTGVFSGAAVAKGLFARSQGGGFGGIGVANAGNAGWLINGEVMLYQSGANLVLLWKKTDGTSATVNLI